MNIRPSINSLVEGKIVDIAFGGEGLIKGEYGVIFVPFCLPGERVQVRITEVKKRYSRAKLVKVLQASKQRIPSLCPHFTHCGGCQFQNMPYPTQLSYKKQFLQQALEKVGGLELKVPIEIQGSQETYAYRQHVNWAIYFKPQAYLAQHTPPPLTSPVELKACPIFLSSPDFILYLQKQLQSLSLPSIPSLRLKILKISSNTFHLSFHLPRYSSAFMHFVSCLKKGPFHLNIDIYYPNAPEKNQEIKAPLWKGLDINYSSRGFLQNHREMSQQLYTHIEKALEVKSSDKGLDLFSGIGVSSLLLAKTANSILSIEKNPHCHKMAVKNAEQNRIHNIEFRCEDVYLSPLKPSFSWALVNPPREGLKSSFLPFLAQVPKIAYLSCNPPTLARDLKALKKLGNFEVMGIRAFDMFPQTTHLESLVLLKR